MANSRICSVEGCGNPHYANNLCGKHRLKLKKYGDPLAGRSNKPAHIGKSFMIDIASEYEGDDCIKWPGYTAKGYGRYFEDGQPKSGCRFLCEVQNGPPPSQHHEAAHTCGNGHLGCSNKTHLVWKTRDENQRDKHLHGTTSHGSRNCFSQLTEQDVAEMRRDNVTSPIEKSKKYGICVQHVKRIMANKCWKRVKA